MTGSGDAEWPERRVILLGASNLVRGISSLVSSAQGAWGQPLDVMAAIGHGRSYGIGCRVLGRALPSIIDCGLWQDLDQRPQANTAALLSDIGNDLLYGKSVEQLLDALSTCLERLAPAIDRLVISQLPMDNIARMTPARFRLLRSMLFPSSRITLDEAIERGEQVNERLFALGHRYGAYIIAPHSNWYGWDPIHVKRSAYPVAWQKIFSCWCDGRAPDLETGSWRSWIQLKRSRPQYRRLFGVVQKRAQPVLRLPDTTRISFY